MLAEPNNNLVPFVKDGNFPDQLGKRSGGVGQIFLKPAVNLCLVPARDKPVVLGVDYLASSVTARTTARA